MKCHLSTRAIQEHVKKCTILEDAEKKTNPNWIILFYQQPVIISRYLIEEGENEELVGEERDVVALAAKTEKDPYAITTLTTCKK